MCTPDWGCSGEHAYWRRMLDRMTVGRVQLPYGPIYVPEDSDTAMHAPEWASFLSIVDGSLNPVPMCDLDQVLLKEVMALNCGLTLSDLKHPSPEHLSATLTGCESPDGYLEPAAVKEDADDQLSEIASTIPPVDRSCVDLKHSAFLAGLFEINWGIWASQKLSGGTLQDLIELQGPKILGYLLIFGSYFKPIAYC